MRTVAEPVLVTGKPRGRGLRPGLLTLLLALTLILLSLGLKAYRLSFPTEGWSSSTDYADRRSVFSENLLGLPSGLKVGDKLLAINGQDFEQLAKRSFSSKAPSPLSYQAGQTVRYTVLRGGETLELDVPLQHWTAAGLTRAVWQMVRGTPNVGENAQRMGGMLQWLMMLVAVFVFVKLPQALPAQLFFLGMMVSLAGLIGSVVSPLSTSDVLQPSALWTARLSYFIIPLLQFPLVLHLLLIVPKPKPLLQGPPWRISLVYLVPWLVFGLTLWIAGSDFLFFVLILVYASLNLLALVHTLLTEKAPSQQAQIGWFALGAGLWSLSLIVLSLWALALMPPAVTGSNQLLPLNLLVGLCLLVAVLRYRLFGADIILNRTLVWGTLTAFVLGVYGLVVGFFGSLWKGENLSLSLLAAGLVALALQPLREWLQRGVNRLIYGQRDEPYAVVAGLGKRLESTLTPAEILPTITQTVAQTLRLPYASLRLAHASDPVAVYGQPGSITERFVLTAQGEKVGELELSPRQGDSFSPTERRLLQDLSRHIASAAKAVQLSEELQRSREALVLAREEERKRLRRDLHDGLGPTLASQTLRLDAASGLVEQNPQAAQLMLGELKAQTQETIAEIRRLVQGLRPPSLDEHGLGGALQNLAHQYGSPSLSVEVWIAQPLPPLPAALEVAAYRIASEALTNVVRHAQASKCSIRLEVKEALELTIEDDGRGILEGYTAGVGLRSMGERARELGGSLEVIPLTKGTRIFARIPLLEV